MSMNRIHRARLVTKIQISCGSPFSHTCSGRRSSLNLWPPLDRSKIHHPHSPSTLVHCLWMGLDYSGSPTVNRIKISEIFYNLGHSRHRPPAFVLEHRSEIRVICPSPNWHLNQPNVLESGLLFLASISSSLKENENCHIDVISEHGLNCDTWQPEVRHKICSQNIPQYSHKCKCPISDVSNLATEKGCWNVNFRQSHKFLGNKDLINSPPERLSYYLQRASIIILFRVWVGT